jgi:ubiquinone biosynthesis protein UbiJ
MQVRVDFSGDRIQLSRVDDSAQETSDADVNVCGSVSALAMLARGRDELPSSAQVTVHGDLEVLSQARSALVRIRPDFDEPLARLLGDEFAYPISRTVRRLLDVARRSGRELGENFAEYLGEESGLLATHDDVRSFVDEVDRLRDALERLDKRVLRVASELESTRSPPEQDPSDTRKLER